MTAMMSIMVWVICDKTAVCSLLSLSLLSWVAVCRCFGLKSKVFNFFQLILLLRFRRPLCFWGEIVVMCRVLLIVVFSCVCVKFTGSPVAVRLIDDMAHRTKVCVALSIMSLGRWMNCYFWGELTEYYLEVFTVVGRWCFPCVWLNSSDLETSELWNG